MHGLLGSCFSRVEPFRQVGKYIIGLMSDLLRKNAWTVAEYVGDATPDRMQRLLNRAAWDTDALLTKPQLAIEITADAIAEGTMPPWSAGAR